MPIAAPIRPSPQPLPRCGATGLRGCASTAVPPVRRLASSTSSACTTRRPGAPLVPGVRPRYASRMETNLEARPARPPIVRRAAAGVVLIVAAALAVKLVIGFVMAIFWTVVAIAVVVAIIWALKTLIW